MMNIGWLNASSSFSCTYSPDIYGCHPSPKGLGRVILSLGLEENPYWSFFLSIPLASDWFGVDVRPDCEAFGGLLKRFFLFLRRRNKLRFFLSD